jgi:hypothetical protein
MNYLHYVERSAENLQFHLWIQDYAKRFQSASASDMALAPEWTQAMEDEIQLRLQREATDKVRRDEQPGVEIFEGTDFEKKPVIAAAEQSPFSTPPPTAVGSNSDKDLPSSIASSDILSNAKTYRSQAGDAFVAAGAKAPCKSMFIPAACRVVSARPR